ncbi:hypothetical protein [Streptomyces sp. NPDC059759]|uniref:hypothetical protein n=1 Tax=Streptomyces sp. NPDC059759 TaxID=3346936 RepID=UPI00364C67DB
MFSASVPLNNPSHLSQAAELLLSSVIEGVEALGWQLESTLHTAVLTLTIRSHRGTVG